MSQNPGLPLNSGTDPSVTTCSNCHSAMPPGLRFCRNCGFRLGEGSAEYTETVRFQNGHPGLGAGPRATSPQSVETTYGLSSSALAASGRCAIRGRRRMSGMSWMFLGLLIFFVAAGVFTALVTPARRNVNIEFGAPAPPRSFVGVDGFDTADSGGVTFGNVEPPGSPADKAGLVGGDIITTFDGQDVKDEDQMSDLLKRTPIGKTVDLVFVRDGEIKTTKLTTVSKEEGDRLASAFNKRPEGKGQFGYEDGDTERVPIPKTNMFGVKLGRILSSRPADLFGIKEGDIVVEFDKVPIRTRDELLSRVRRALPYSTVTVVVMRDNQRLEIPVKMGRQ